MGDVLGHGTEVWDRLFDLLYAEDDTDSDDDVKAELESLGIDMRPAYQRFHQMIEQHKARSALANAREAYSFILEEIKSIAAPHVENIQAGIEQLIARISAGQEQVAHFQRLKAATSQEDLQSLLDDLTKLAAIRENAKKDETKAE